MSQKVPNHPHLGFVQKIDGGYRHTVITDSLTPKLPSDIHVELDISAEDQAQVQPHKLKELLKLAATRRIRSYLKENSEHSAQITDEALNLSVAGGHDAVDSYDLYLNGEVLPSEIEAIKTMDVDTGPLPTYFSISYEGRGERRMATLTGESESEIARKLVVAVAEHEALLARAEFLQKASRELPETSALQQASKELESEIGMNNVEALMWGLIEVDGVFFDELGAQENPLDALMIEEIPAAHQISESGTYEVVVDVACVTDRKKLDKSFIDGNNNCFVEGMHRVVFRHDDHDLTKDEIQEIALELFRENLPYGNSADFECSARMVSPNDHPADFVETHGIFEVQPEPTLTSSPI